MRVDIIDTPDALTPLREGWNALAGGVPFRLWEWNAAWFRHYGARDRLLTLAVYDGAGQLAGLAPWRLQRSAAKGRVVRFLADGEVCSDYQRVLCRAGAEDEVTEAVVTWLNCEGRGRWDLLEFSGLEADDPANRRLLAHLQAQGATIHRREGLNCWRLTLPDSWDEYERLLSKSHRKQIRRFECRAFDPGLAVVRRVEHSGQFEQAYAMLIDLHQRRWTNLGQPGVFASPTFTAFHREIAQTFLADGRLRMSTLEFQGRPVAAEYHFLGDDGVLYAYQGGLEPEAMQEEPGRLSLVATLRGAFAEGCQAVDFLRGDEPYKPHWRGAAFVLRRPRGPAACRGSLAAGRVGSRPAPQALDDKTNLGRSGVRQRGNAMTALIKSLLIRPYYYGMAPIRLWRNRRAAAAGRAPVMIVFYHRIADDEANSWTLSHNIFRRQIDWLQSNFEMVSLTEAQRRIAGETNGRPCVSVTFDDGYADNCRRALPLLLERKIPFTYFVTTRNALKQEPFAHDVANGDHFGPNTVAQLRALSAAGVEIGAHTRTHPDLGRMTDIDALYDEVVTAGRDLSAAINAPVRYFAFPYGLPDNLNPEAFFMAREAGYRGVCSAYGGYNYPGDDAFHLQRIPAEGPLMRLKNWITVDPVKEARIERYDYRRVAFQNKQRQAAAAPVG